LSRFFYGRGLRRLRSGLHGLGGRRRRGGFYLVYLWAALYYALRLRHKCDIIVDCQTAFRFLRLSTVANRFTA